MAAGDWIHDLIQAEAYEMVGRKRKVNFEKLWALVSVNGGDDLVKRAANDAEMNAGQKVMQASNVLRGSARRQRGLRILDKDGSTRMVDAPSEWIAHYAPVRNYVNA